MGKIAFVFAGQGAQATGMGKSICEAYDSARKVFEYADSIRPGTSEMCFEGPDSELLQTKNTQPCLYVTEMALAAALEECGVKADMTAGFSLGELSALTYAGAADLKTGLELVIKRGQFMQDAAEKAETMMAAVVGLERTVVEELAAKFENVYPVNYNCPGQISVTGDKAEMKQFIGEVKTAGGRGIPVKVSGAFHSPYMDSAAAEFAKEIEKCGFKAPDKVLYSNFTAEKYNDDIVSNLSPQMNHPVKWEDTIQKMIAEGVDTFIEVGPGKTLQGFVKKTNKEVRAFGVSDADSLEKVLKEVL